MKRGAANIQRQRQPVLRRFNQAHHLRHQRFILRIAADQLGVGEFVLQILHQLLRIVPQQNGADAHLALRRQDLAQRTAPDGEMDAHAFAARPIGLRRHAQRGVGLLVEAAIGAIAGVEDRVGHRFPLCKTGAQALAALRIGVAFRRQAGDRFEQPVEMVLAQPDVARQRLQRRRFFRPFDIAAGRGYLPRMLFRQRRQPLPAAFAGPITRRLRLLRIVEQLHVLPIRLA